MAGEEAGRNGLSAVGLMEDGVRDLLGRAGSALCIMFFSSAQAETTTDCLSYISFVQQDGLSKNLTYS